MPCDGAMRSFLRARISCRRNVWEGVCGGIRDMVKAADKEKIAFFAKSENYYMP